MRDSLGTVTHTDEHESVRALMYAGNVSLSDPSRQSASHTLLLLAGRAVLDDAAREVVLEGGRLGAMARGVSNAAAIRGDGTVEARLLCM